MKLEDIKSKIKSGISDPELNDFFSKDIFWGSREDVIVGAIACLYMSGRLECALNLIQESKARAFDFSKEFRVEVLYISGDIFHDLMDYESAINAYTAILSIQESDIAFGNRGLAFWELERLDDALRDYQKAIELNQNKSIYFSSIGMILCEREQYVDAIPYLERAVELDPKDSRSFRYLGIAYYNKEDDWAKAYRALTRAFELDPTDKVARLGIDKILNHFDLKD